MVRDQETTVRELLDSLVLEWDESCLNHHKSDRVSKYLEHLAG